MHYCNGILIEFFSIIESSWIFLMDIFPWILWVNHRFIVIIEISTHDCLDQLETTHVQRSIVRSFTSWSYSVKTIVSVQYPTVRETTVTYIWNFCFGTETDCAAIAYNNTRLCRDFARQEIISGAGNSREDIPIRDDSPWCDCHKSINLQRKSPSALVRKV